MAKTRIAINGFGRTGRCLAMQLYNNSAFEIAAINNRSPICNTFLITFDSVYGKFDAQVELKEKEKQAGRKTIKEKYLQVNKHAIPLFQSEEPIALPWAELDIDIVVDATGNFPLLKNISDHCDAGAKNVIMTYPPKQKEIKTIMVGINEKTYDPQQDRVISAGSCTGLALAPLLKYLDAEWGVEYCAFLTTHCYTDSQNLLDNANKDPWRSRAGALNIIPTTTGAEHSIPAVLPNLEGKIIGMANRVPTPVGSQLFLSAELKKEVTKENVNDYFTLLAQKQAASLIDICAVPACSSYFKGNPHAVIIDPYWTHAAGKKLRMIAWFDNEWGYAARLVALLEYVSKQNNKKGWF